MNRNILQDIKPLTSTGRRGVITELKSKDEYSSSPRINPEQNQPRYTPPSSPNNRDEFENGESSPRKSKKAIWIVTILALGVLFVAISFMFKGAVVEVVPKSQHVKIEDTFVAKNGGDDNELTFEVVEMKEEASRAIDATETKEVSRKATGKITLFNKTTTSQPLKIDTRLETKDGKIFKTDKAITVPAGKTVSGKVVPGQIEVAVTADQAGDEYNIGASDFVIFGFKGTSKADKFSGQSKASMTGGFKGVEADIKEEDRTALKEQLSEELKASLLSKVSAQVPAEFIYYDEGIFFTPAQTLLVTKVDGKVNATLSGSLSIILFNEGKITRDIAKETVTEYDNEDIVLQGLKSMKFSLKNKESINPKEAKDISFTLSGEADFVWSVDTDTLRDQLVGKKKKEFTTILSSFTSIESAEVSINPIWMTSFPALRKDIIVKLTPINAPVE